jgi:nucleoside-diphosphate-sugar epimerase
MIWRKIRGDRPFQHVCDAPYIYDVRKRVPSTEKAARLLGFQARTRLNEVLDILIPWVKQQVMYGNI